MSEPIIFKEINKRINGEDGPLFWKDKKLYPKDPDSTLGTTDNKWSTGYINKVVSNQIELSRQDDSNSGEIVRYTNSGGNFYIKHQYDLTGNKDSVLPVDGDPNAAIRFVASHCTRGNKDITTSTLIWANGVLYSEGKDPKVTENNNEDHTYLTVLGTENAHWNGAYIDNLYSSNIGGLTKYVTNAYITNVQGTNISTGQLIAGEIGTSDDPCLSANIDTIDTTTITGTNLGASGNYWTNGYVDNMHTKSLGCGVIHLSNKNIENETNDGGITRTTSAGEANFIIEHRFNQESPSNGNALISLKAYNKMNGIERCHTLHWDSGKLYPTITGDDPPSASIGTTNFPWKDIHLKSSIDCFTTIHSEGINCVTSKEPSETTTFFTISNKIPELDTEKRNECDAVIQLIAQYRNSSRLHQGTLIWGRSPQNHMCLYGLPDYISNSVNTYPQLGTEENYWGKIYVVDVDSGTGVAQSSTAELKDSIRYIQSATTMIQPLSLFDETETESAEQLASITTEDIIDFVRNCKPATFCYKNGQEEATEENSSQSSIQIGFIAEDLRNHPVYKYIGIDETIQKEISPQEVDETGEVIKEAEYEETKHLALQILPLTTVALTACKQLIEENDNLHARLCALEEKFEMLESKLSE